MAPALVLCGEISMLVRIGSLLGRTARAVAALIVGARLTESGDQRLTEDGRVRVREDY